MLKVLSVALLPVSVLSKATYSYDPLSSMGPMSWGALNITDNQCGGSKQSGIDIPRTGCEEYADYIFSAGSCSLNDMDFTLNDHGVQASYKTDGCTPPRMIIPGKDNPFDVLQFHFHTGVDHALNGQYFGADMHIVHKEVGGDMYAVLGYFVQPNNPSDTPVFGNILTEWESVETAVYKQCNPSSSNDTVSAQSAGGGRSLRGRELETSFDIYGLMPEGATIYTYDGSLTTPPCSEVVYWNVVDKPVSMSVREYLRLTNLVLDYVDPGTCEPASVAAPSGYTGRPVQPINGRKITHVCPSAQEPASE